jgi:hypothetical protein
VFVSDIFYKKSARGFKRGGIGVMRINLYVDSAFFRHLIKRKRRLLLFRNNEAGEKENEN